MKSNPNYNLEPFGEWVIARKTDSDSAIWYSQPTVEAFLRHWSEEREFYLEILREFDANS